MLHPQQPKSWRRLWGFVVGIKSHKLATSCKVVVVYEK